MHSITCSADVNSENKVKNGLLLLAKDLELVSGYPLLTVHPRAILTKSYVNVPLSAVKSFETDYSENIKHLDDRTKRLFRRATNAMNPTPRSSTAEKSMNWTCPPSGHPTFRDMSFSQFNYKFFSGNLFQCKSGERFAPRIHIRADYRYPVPGASRKAERLLYGNRQHFSRARKPQGEMFTADDFRKHLADGFGEDFDRLDFSRHDS